MKLVIVEFPAKAKTINRYLGDDYKALASYGHVCDLPSKDGSVLDEDFAMKWQVSSGSETARRNFERASQGRQPHSGDGPRPRGRGHQLVCA